MKYLLASDIHGDALACKFIVDEFNNGNYDKLILLGDILYHGPRNDLPVNYRPKEVIALLNPLADKIIAVKGNCEAYVDQMVLKFKILEDQFIDLNNKTYYLCHGHKLNFTGEDLPKGTIIIYGHYHIPSLKEYTEHQYLNVGSIALPKENNPKTFGILNDNGLEVLDMNKNVIIKL